ncbi:MAG TPA: hypothetical protein VKA08_11010 [Balneolales bacterium]|nr:hypothetical protein [Balneolales bacterium]
MNIYYLKENLRQLWQRVKEWFFPTPELQPIPIPVRPQKQHP